MRLPEPVLTCIHRLERAGFPAYAVGGCVRDHLLGREPNDYDLCTAASPKEICRVFADCRLIHNGEKHGTIGVILEGEVYEITTFRKEGTYQDCRHPDWVEFVSDVKEDLARRDFTVNSMAYAPEKGLINPFGGRQDLENHILRAVGNPETRFREDALRILRGVRFAVRFGLQPEPETQKAMERCSCLMEQLAAERIFDELCKLLPVVKAGDLLGFAPVITQVIPELREAVGFCQHSPYHKYDVYTHICHVVENTPSELPLRWAALLHDAGKPGVFTQDAGGRGHFYGHDRVSAQLTHQVLLRLKAPTVLREQVEFLVSRHMMPWEGNMAEMRRRMGKFGAENIRMLLQLQKADALGKGTAVNLADTVFPNLEALFQQVLTEKACLTVHDLAVNGRDFIEMGMQPGPELGRHLEMLLGMVQEEKVSNTREALLAVPFA